MRADAAARRIVAAWRGLTGGRSVRDRDRGTVVACSGGADSTALAVVLALAGEEAVTIGHVEHDLRPEPETLAERDRVRELAERLGVEFAEASVAVRDLPANAEANARRERYRELERMAFEAGRPFVATAHHADDQLETMLMALVRGSGVRGLGGMPVRRGLGGRGIGLVRPMARVRRSDAERICTLAGLEWATDPTNADVSRLRAAVRHGAARELGSLRPQGAERAAAAAAQLREVADLLEGLAAEVLERATVGEREIRWERGEFAGVHRAVVGAALRRAYGLLHGGRHADRLPARSVGRVVGAIGEGGGGARRFDWRGVTVEVTARDVVLRRSDS